MLVVVVVVVLLSEKRLAQVQSCGIKLIILSKTTTIDRRQVSTECNTYLHVKYLSSKREQYVVSTRPAFSSVGEVPGELSRRVKYGSFNAEILVEEASSCLARTK